MANDITQVISTIPAFGKRGVETRDIFVSNQEAGQDHLSYILEQELNTFGTQANNLKSAVNTDMTTTVTAKDATLASQAIVESIAQYKGDWSSTYTNGYSVNDSVTFTDGLSYTSKVTNNSITPVTLTSDANWKFNGRIDFVYKLITANTTSVNLDFLGVDTLTTGAVTVTLPIGIVGNKVKFTDIKSNWDINNLTIAPVTGEIIMGLAIDETLVVSTKNLTFGLEFIDGNWRVV